MNLLALAEADNAFILEDADHGFGTALTLTDLVGTVYQVVGQFFRIGVEINDLGLLVAGSKLTATVRLSSLGGAIPAEGWTVSGADSTGATVTAKVQKSGVMLDRTAGRATLMLKVI